MSCSFVFVLDGTLQNVFGYHWTPPKNPGTLRMPINSHAYKFKKVGRYNNISCNNERFSLLNKNFPTEILAFNTVLKLSPCHSPLEILLKNAF